MVTPFGFFALVETFSQPGCAICNLLVRDATQMVDAILYEYVTDVEAQAQFRESRGLCKAHGQLALTNLGNSLGIAILYQSVLKDLLAVVDQSPSPQKRLAQMLSAQNPNATLINALKPEQPCLVCQQQSQNEIKYLGILSEYISDEKLQTAYRGSEGLCPPHFRQILGITSQADRARILIDIQRDIWRALQEDLLTYMRKRNKEYAEKIGEEGDSWRRAVLGLGENSAI